jgi:hypothetical protein
MTDLWTHDHSMEYLYLPYMFLYLFFFFLAVSILCFYQFDRKHYFTQYSQHQRSEQRFCCWPAYECAAWKWICCCWCCPQFSLPLLRLEANFESSIFGNIGSLILFLSRMVSLAYLIYFNQARYSIHYHEIFQTYEGWTTLAAFSYFVLACNTSSSTTNVWLAPLCHRQLEFPRFRIWSLLTERLGTLNIIIRAIALGNCVFYALVHLVFFNLNGDIHENRRPLAPAFATLIDMLLSRLPLCMEHYVYALGLLVAYFFTTWIRVFMGKIDWPYEQLTLDSPVCFRNYSALLLAHVTIYILLYLVCQIRDYFLQLKPDQMYHVPRYANYYRTLTSNHQNTFVMPSAPVADGDDVELGYLGEEHFFRDEDTQVQMHDEQVSVITQSPEGTFSAPPTYRSSSSSQAIDQRFSPQRPGSEAILINSPRSITLI